MRYIVENLPVPEEFNSKFQDKSKYSFSYVCQNCGAELHWEFNYPVYRYYDSWEYSRARDELEQYRRLYPRDNYLFNERYLKNLEQKFNLQKEKKEKYDFMKRIADNAHQRYQDALQNAVCPSCGAGLVQEKGY